MNATATRTQKNYKEVIMKKKSSRKTTKPRKGHGEKFSRKDEEAIDALITEPTIKAAAKKVGLGEKTLRRWLEDPDFREDLDAERMHRLEAATRGLEQAAPEAIASLQRVLSDSRYSRDWVPAAKAVLDALFKKARLHDTGRLSELERKGQAREQAQSVHDTGEEFEPLTDESAADAPHLVPLSKVPGPTPSIPNQSRPDTALSAEAERGGEEKPTEGLRIRRR